ncbi:glycosyltransferase family 2 protein [Tuwongella immobilis]|uniref:Glycosyltransferase 2-like domain-containing protein n=1 Tax=Tuwongella immobilis TaxID=692036 RepID=A0A6C2YI78_9BACT|nr:glycosyltransferase family 2 protein [Tuwongella immobilis]VIP01116.1 Glycosyl transferase family 2 OS=Thermodesulfobium narugense DSM 14796 GN=Thena_0396 PE=4 SV=1: Glycos_transf_2: Glycos_transf_2 [Tuwongella immobilis]VTR97657.1 Glycosyl transferase family 2 OS=Thermodesulfobium narugense DSM 14796 GN=Thena_0396 PE=4 SV=1: Glycos_transf_2: Glycos_transf_2 [Tuwongella immobilis]
MASVSEAAQSSADDSAHALIAAQRRIAQLEHALAKRSEQLHQTHHRLMTLNRRMTVALHKRLLLKLRDKLMPPRTRRRAIAKRLLRVAIRSACYLAGRPMPPLRDWQDFAATIEKKPYHLWIDRFEPKRAELDRQRHATFAVSPLISIVVPTYNTPLTYLEAMVDSVRQQTYSNWELCLADGGSTLPGLRERLTELANHDPRIKVMLLEKNAGIVGNSNAAIGQATGEFVAMLDHDDTLAPFALYEIVSAINQVPDADVLYSDEDKLDSEGDRCEPLFKPDWSPETLRSLNYICHLFVLKRSLLLQLGGFRSAFNGAQDYDLILRATEKAKRIIHIPKVLYHWRMHSNSTAQNPESKQYAFEAGKRALADHLHRLKVAGTVLDGPLPGLYHIDYALVQRPLVTVIIPNKDQVHFLRGAMASLFEATYANYEVIIVENGSKDPATWDYYATLEREPHIRILKWDKPFNYAAVNNFAVTHARGELLLFLNNDVRSISPTWLENLVKQAIQPGIGAVGAKLYFEDDTIQHAGVVLGIGGLAGHTHVHFPRQAPGYANRLWYAQNYGCVTAACLMMPRQVFEKVGGFDEGYILAFNDVDLCVQVIEHHFRIVWTPDVELYHFESKTRGPEDTEEKVARFQREFNLFHLKWGEFLAKGDPYFNPNLRLDRTDCLPRME